MVDTNAHNVEFRLLDQVLAILAGELVAAHEEAAPGVEAALPVRPVEGVLENGQAEGVVQLDAFQDNTSNVQNILTV